MAKLFSHSDSEESSDEDNGNFKRRRCHSSEQTGNFMVKTSSFSATSSANKPLRVIDSRPSKEATKKHESVNQKLSSLTTYDDLFDSNEGLGQTTFLSNATPDLKPQPLTQNDLPEFPLITATIEVFKDCVDSPATGVGIKCKSVDPRLKRLELRAKGIDEEEPISRETTLERREKPTIPSVGSSIRSVIPRLNELLNQRKPFEAYHHLKGSTNILELHRYVDLMMVMAKDWFPSLIDNSLDPKSVYIETENLNKFTTLIKDLISCKVKSTEFWESVIVSVEKFIDQSRIKVFPQLLSKLRWILVKDIRDHLKDMGIRISLKVSGIILDHKVKLESHRDRHRRQFEEQFAQRMQMNSKITAMAMPTLALATPAPTPIISGVPKRQTPTPISDPLSPLPVDPNEQLPKHQYYNSFQSSGVNPSVTSNDRRTITQIIDCIQSDQITKLIQMMNRHTNNNNYSFIESFGFALRLSFESNPKLNIFQYYQKIHDFLHLNQNDFKRTYPGADCDRINTLFAKILNEFYETVCLNTKEWILIRDHSRTHCVFKVISNPFNEPFFPINHNVVPDCGYESHNIRVNYTAIEEDIPLLAPNIILKDPRIELRTESHVQRVEFVDLEEAMSGKFSPVFQSTSDSNSPQYCTQIISPQTLTTPVFPTQTHTNTVITAAKKVLLKKKVKKVILQKRKINANNTLNKTLKASVVSINKSTVCQKKANVLSINQAINEPNVETIVNSSDNTTDKPIHKSPNKAIPGTPNKTCDMTDELNELKHSVNGLADKPTNAANDVNQCKNIISLKKFNESELKTIVRKVELSSDSSEEE